MLLAITALSGPHGLVGVGVRVLISVAALTVAAALIWRYWRVARGDAAAAKLSPELARHVKMRNRHQGARHGLMVRYDDELIRYKCRCGATWSRPSGDDDPA